MPRQARIKPRKRSDDSHRTSFVQLAAVTSSALSLPALDTGGGKSARGSHHMKDNLGCPTNWELANFLHVFPRERGNYYTDFGTLVHTGLAYLYAARQTRKPQWYQTEPDVEVALLRDAKGNPKYLRDCKELLSFYKYFESTDPWETTYIEEVFEASVGAIDPTGADEPAETLEYVKDDGITVEVKLPSLNAEIVTCRPDAIIVRNGRNFIVDHKTAGAARNGSNRLPVLSDHNPDYTYIHQACVNLHIVRQSIDVMGFMFNRIKRDVPFDVSRDMAKIPDGIYASVPATIRASIKKERELIRRACRREPMEKYLWECHGSKYKCGYVRLCYAENAASRHIILNTEYSSPSSIGQGSIDPSEFAASPKLDFSISKNTTPGEVDVSDLLGFI